MLSDEKRIPHGVCRGGLLVAWDGFEPSFHSQALVLYLTSYRLNDQAMVGKGPQPRLRAFSFEEEVMYGKVGVISFGEKLVIVLSSTLR